MFRRSGLWSAPLALTVVCFVIGVLLAAQYQAQNRTIRSTTAQSGADQAAIVGSLYENNVALRREVVSLQSKIQEHEESFSQTDLEDTVKALNQLRLVNGLSEVSGPGVTVTVSGAIRPQDMLDLVNELRNAGAEAVAVNDERVIVRTAFSGDTRQLLVNGRPVQIPFRLRAIGHADTLERALLRKGGLVIYLQSTYPGLYVGVSKEGRMTIPLFHDGYTFRFARMEQ